TGGSSTPTWGERPAQPAIEGWWPGWNRPSSSRARVVTRGSGGPVTRVGSPIVYGLTVPKNAPQPELAVDFVKFLLGPDGQRITAAGGMVPVRASDVHKVPAVLRGLVQ